jgi:hypothetical protein
LALAVMDAVRYAGIFDFPLTREEICAFVGIPEAAPADVDRAIAGLLEEPDGLEIEGDFVFRKGEGHMVATRIRRNAHAARLWRRAAWPSFYAGRADA